MNKNYGFNRNIIGEKWKKSKTFCNFNCCVHVFAFNNVRMIFGSGMSNGYICVSNLKFFNNINFFPAHEGIVRTIFFDEQTNYFFTGGNDMSIKLWDLDSGKNVRNYLGHTDGITKIKKHPTLNLIISSSMDKTLRLWDVRIRKEVKVICGHRNTVSSILCNREKPHVISGGLDNSIHFWDLVADKCYLEIKKYGIVIRNMKKLYKQRDFCVLDHKSLRIFNTDGLNVKNIYFMKHSTECFSINQNHEIIIGTSNGEIIFLKSLYKNTISSMKILSRNTMIKQVKILAVEFNSSGDQFIESESNGSVNVFKKKWSVF